MLELTDSEKRDIIKYLNKNKELPEKYRFLLFDDAREVELLWKEKTNEITNTVLPFQTIEHIDEPRSEEKISAQKSIFDVSGRQMKGWTNKLIWGDNKLILSSLKNGPLRKKIEDQGGLKLIYIDPPFDIGADFSMDIKIGDEEFTKKPSAIEEIAYRDTWGKGADSFIAMIYERLKLMHGLLAQDGSIYVHCDWRVNSLFKLVLQEVFAGWKYSEIIWICGLMGQGNVYPKSHETILYFYNSESIYNPQGRLGLSPRITGSLQKDDIGWFYTRGQESSGGETHLKSYISKNPAISKNEAIDEANKNRLQPVWDVWMGKKDLAKNFNDYPTGTYAYTAKEKVGYPTQKPEALLERIIKASSNEGDLIADFFCGSGTTLAVAEKLGRKWIGTDLGRFSIHTTRKRMIGVQREMKKDGKDFRAFEILNIGRYEREHFVGVNENLREEEKRKQQERKEREFIELILAAYKAVPVNSFNNFVGKKRDRLVAIGPITVPVTQEFISQAMEECKQKGITKFDVLGFDYEMGLDFSKISKQGINAQFKVIPREVFDKRAVEKGQVKFYDVAYIEIRPIIRGRRNSKELAVGLTDFSVFYNQDNTGEVDEKLKSGGSKVVIENGQVIKIWKDKDTDIIEREVLTKKWTDWVDYWSVDFDFESKKEIIRVEKNKKRQTKLDGSQDSKQLELHNFEEVWTGNYIFENEWQSFRTKKDRKFELTSVFKQVPKGKLKVAVKVVDIFGNDTTKIVEINI